MSMDLNPNDSLHGVIRTMIQNVIGNIDLPDVVIGTVETVGPLSIRVSPQILLPADVLILTETVCFKKVDYTHTHSDPQGGSVAPSLNNGVTVSTAAGDNSPQAPYTMINRDLIVGDKVVMIRVLGGQQYIVLSRVVNG